VSRILLCISAFAVLAPPCQAGTQLSGSETLVRLSVAPAPAPTPALRHRLLPELQEMMPGNPIQGYFRAFMVHEKFFVDDAATKRREMRLAMPLKALPAEEIRDYGRLVLAQVDRAARLDRPDWQILPRLKTEGFHLLLPDVQQVRSLARALAVRFRAEVAMGHFESAIGTAKTLFAMAHHLGEHPTLIGNLVGIAIAYQAIEPLEEMLEQPGCPNLFWALTTLPSPFKPLAMGMEGERVLLLAEFRDLDDEAPMDADRIKRFAVRWDQAFGNGEAARSGKRIRAWLDARTKDERLLESVRRRLVESGLPEERLRRFPAEQVLLLNEKQECLGRFDEVMKLMSLPYWQIDSRLADLARNKPPALLADDVLPGIVQPRRAQERLEQRIALLRHVEALRLHAAENHGAIPTKLTEIAVPLPNDPFTGKPFRYELEDGTVHLRGGHPKGEGSNPSFNIHFEITLQK